MKGKPGNERSKRTAQLQLYIYVEILSSLEREG